MITKKHIWMIIAAVVAVIVVVGIIYKVNQGPKPHQRTGSPTAPFAAPAERQ
jgi:hypothetical protein